MPTQNKPAVRSEVKKMPVPADTRVGLRCLNDVRFGGVHYLPGDEVRVEKAVAAAMRATGDFE